MEDWRSRNPTQCSVCGVWEVRICDWLLCCSGECEAIFRSLEREKLHGKPHARAKRRAKIYAAGDISVSGPDLVQALRDKYGDLCWLCEFDIKFDADSKDPLSPHVDHLVPLYLGGKHNWDNVGLAHARCNMSKGAKLVEFRWSESCGPVMKVGGSNARLRLLTVGGSNG